MFKLFRKKEVPKIDNLNIFIKENIDGFIKKYLTDEVVNNIVLAIEEICNSHNLTISDLELVNVGQDAITFKLNNKIIKLTFVYLYGAKTITDYVSHSIFILKPDKELLVDINSEYVCAHILETRKLDMTKIREKDVIDLYIKLREDGYLWEDTKIRNIGRDVDGIIKLIDYGELICSHYLNYREYEQKLYNHINYRSYYNEEYNKRFVRKM